MLLLTIIIIMLMLIISIMTTNLRSLDDNPSPERKVCECFPLKLLPAPHPTQAPFRFWSRPGHTCHTDDGGDGGEEEDDNDGDSNHSDDVDGGKEEDEDLPNVAVPLRDSAVSLLDIQLVGKSLRSWFFWL